MAAARAGFIDVDYTHEIMLCTEMAELVGDDATGSSVDASVLAAAPVPEGSLIPISEITANAAQARGDADGKNTPRVALRATCRDPRILSVAGAVSGMDPATRMKRVFAWVFRVTDPGGTSLDYRFRARLRSVSSFQEGSRWAHNVFLYSYDACPVVTGPGGDVVPTGGRLRRGSGAPRQAGEFCPGEPPPALRDHGAALACAGRGRGNRTLWQGRMARALWEVACRARLAKIFNKGPAVGGAVTTEAVARVGFIDADYTHEIMLCTEMAELVGDDATGGSVDASVLAAAPVPEGSLIPISEITASAAQAGGDADGKNTPRVALRVICRDPRIQDVTRVAFRVDPATRKGLVHVWVFRVTDPDGVTRDYRFRARLRSVASYEEGPGRVYNVFLYSYDARPTVTRPEDNLAPGVS